jgi:4'-phosphopantetheinyl transferase
MSTGNNGQLTGNAVHLWRAALNITADKENEYLALFNAEERLRAARFHFPLHRRRFIAARGMLRELLGRYLNVEPAQVNFSYQERGKPFLADTTLQFNVSHSHDLAVFAFTLFSAVGVDVEKTEMKFNDSVAKRYFHALEYSQLHSLPEAEQAREFFRIWSRKEALIKAIGEGVYFSLSSFSALGDAVSLNVNGEKSIWYVQDFESQSGYQSAFATQTPTPEITCFDYPQK